VLSGVPRVYEKAFSNVVANGLAERAWRGRSFRVAMREFEKYAEAKEKGQSYSSFDSSWRARWLFPEIKETLSSDSAAGSGPSCPAGAPLEQKIAIFFDLLGFDILEGYGLTETIGLTSVNLPGQKSRVRSGDCSRASS